MTWTQTARPPAGAGTAAEPHAEDPRSATSRSARLLRVCVLVFVASLLVGLTAWITAGWSFWWDPDDYPPEYFRPLVGSFVFRGLGLALWPAGVLGAAVALVVALRAERSRALGFAVAASLLAASHVGATVHWTFDAERQVARLAASGTAQQGEALAPAPVPAPDPHPDGEPPTPEVPEQHTALTRAELRLGVEDLRTATLAVMQGPIPNLMLGPLDAPPVEVACVPGGETGLPPAAGEPSGIAYTLELSLSSADTIEDEQRIFELWEERGLTYDRAMGTNYAGGPASQAIDQVRMRGDSEGWLNLTITSHCSPDGHS